MKESIANRFLHSALTLDGQFTSVAQTLEWVQERSAQVHVKIEPTLLSSMSDWYFDSDCGRVRHRSGKFFSIDGISVNTNYGSVNSWNQPIINQPEIGFLGCLVKEFSGVLYFLVQAKIEPGNINCVQLSPTLQATKSNYQLTHRGKAPRYLEYFADRGRGRVLIDQLQSEQGARFLNKRNRNIIVEVFEDVKVEGDFCWLTLGQIKKLISVPNAVNMDLRTVVSGIPFDRCDPAGIQELALIADVNDDFRVGMLNSAMTTENAMFEIDEIISWFTGLKTDCELEVSQVDLRSLERWELTDEGIVHEDGLYFDVKWVNVEISNREVAFWNQPLVAPRQHGLAAFLVKSIGGVYHFLVQAKLECGNFDLLEFAPTVQCLTGSYKDSLDRVPFLRCVVEAAPEQIKYDAIQSEEGGRFYHEQNRYMLVEVGDEFPVDVPSHFRWFTLGQLLSFIRYNNYLNVQCRGLLSGVCFR